MKKLLTLVLALSMVLCLAACGTSAPAASTAPAASEAPAEASVTYNVGICQLVQHPALDAATQGFIDTLTAKLGDQVSFNNQNASNDTATCSLICNQFVSDGVDLIMANATPSLQAAVSATGSIPILGTSVTEYGVALGIDGFTGKTGMNVSGTSDLAPLDAQAQMLIDLLPDAKTVGLVFCTSEANSRYQVDVVGKYLTDAGLTVSEYAFSDSNDVASVVAAACAECDALYIPTDNTAASCAEAINNVALPAGVPIIAGEEGICSGCGIATLSIDYYDLGCATGEMAYELLTQGADIASMDIRYAPQFTKKYNAANCKALSIPIPEDYVVIE